MDNIIQEWEQRQLLNKERPLFFTVRYRAVLDTWNYFRDTPIAGNKGPRLSFVTLEEAEEVAKDQSVHYLHSITGVFIGDSDIVLSLWEDGQCLYNNPICANFYGINYGPMWR